MATNTTHALSAEKLARAFATAVETASDGVAFIARDGRIVYANSAMAQAVGYTRGELLALSAVDLEPGLDAASLSRRFEELRHRGGRISIESYLRARDGQLKPIELTGSLIELDGEEYAVVFAHNIGRRRKFQEDVAQTSRRLSWVLEALGQGEWEWDVPTGQVHFSAQWLETLGYAPAEVPGNVAFWQSLIHPDDVERVRTALDDHLEGRTAQATVEYRLKTKSGDWRWVVDRARVVEQGPDGRVTTVLGLLEDVTERKRLETELMHAQRLENIGRLAGAIAHDFNNLLTVINGYGEMALGVLDPRDPLYESIKEIKSAGDRAAVLTQQLLAFSRRQVMQAKVLRVNDVVADMQRMLRRLLGENIELVLACDPGLGETKADPVQVQQAIMNLAVNARDAMPDGGQLVIETANVDLGPEITSTHPDVSPGPYVSLSVSDTGLGMDEATLARLFEPFFTTKEKGKGTGLGLSTVYGIVKQSGGHVHASSKVGEGSTFTLYLPRVGSSSAQSAPRPPEPAAVSGHETIVLVEDQAEVRQVALQALARYGYRVLSASDGSEARDLLSKQPTPVALVLTDVMMPGMTGTDLASWVATNQPGTKVLFMSGYTDEVSMPAGADYVQKPFTPEGLARKIRQMLDASPDAASAPETPHVLVVDDEAEIRKLLRQMLEQAGYPVTEAADGKRAVAAVDAGGIRLVITDLVMPEKEGIETIREMRRHHPDVKIIAMSGAFGGRFLRTAEMLGAHATLSKPVRADVLVRTVRSVLAD